jgi:hypothetical protein
LGAGAPKSVVPVVVSIWLACSVGTCGKDQAPCLKEKGGIMRALILKMAAVFVMGMAISQTSPLWQDRVEKVTVVAERQSEHKIKLGLRFSADG